MRTLEDVAQDSGITVDELERKMRSNAHHQAWRMLCKAPPHLTQGVKYATLVKAALDEAQTHPPPSVRSSTIEGRIMTGGLARFLGLKKIGAPDCTATVSLDYEDELIQRSVEAAAVKATGNQDFSDRFENRARLLRCWEAIDTLDPKFRQAIYLRWGIGCQPLNHREAGNAIGMSHEIVRRRERAALATLALQGIVPGDLKAMVLNGSRWWAELLTSALTLDEQKRMPTTERIYSQRRRKAAA